MTLDLHEFKKVLFVGMGGGFDVYGCLPLLPYYPETDFIFANLNAEIPEVRRHPGDHPLSPEGKLADFLSPRDAVVYAFPRTGVRPLRKTLETIVADHAVDCVVLIDGGVDSLMTGDEAGAGTILEDTVTMAAARMLPAKKYLACLGFGTETEEGLCHHYALEKIAEITAAGGFLGTHQLLKGDVGFEYYRSACDSAWADGSRKSHVHTKVISAVEGNFGRDNRYEGVDPRLVNPLDVNYINPLMSLMWFFDLQKVAERNIYVRAMEHTSTNTDAFMVYRQHRPDSLRPNVTIPL